MGLFVKKVKHYEKNTINKQPRKRTFRLKIRSYNLRELNASCEGSKWVRLGKNITINYKEMKLRN